jgi:hypothetical protein
LAAKPPPIETNSVPAEKRSWFQLLAPSVTDLFFIALLAGLSCGALGRILLRDSDIGWHIRNGQLILQTHAITRTDPFSSTMAGQPWFAWEWLYDILIAVIHQVFGLNGVVFYSAAIIAATFVLALHVALRRGGNLPLTIFLLIIALGATAIHFLARPHIVSWLFTVIWFDVLDSAEQHPGKQIYWLPLLMILWVNLHGGFVLGFMLLAVYLVAAGVQFFWGKTREQSGAWLKRLSLLTLLSAAASFVNPYGYHLHVHVYRYLTDRFLMDRITEFASPDFHAVPQQCFAVLLLIAILAVATARRKQSLVHVLVLLLAAYSGFYATRSLPTSSLLMVLIIAPMLSQTIASAAEDVAIARWLRRFFSWLRSFSERMGRMETQFRGHLWVFVVFVLGLWACANHGRIGSAQFLNAYFDDKRFPVESAEYIAAHEIHDPIFSLDYWGGYLIYRLYPETNVVLDDRHDLYGDHFFEDYLKVVWVQPGWNKVLDERHVNWVLVPPQSTLANMLRLTQGWTAEHEDKTAVLFQRNQKL